MKFRNKKTGEIIQWGSTLINSALLSAQSRQRHYWCNWAVEQPEDRGIVLRDIIEHDVDDVNSEGWHKWFNENKEFQLGKKYSAILSPEDKAITMTARQYASYNGNFVRAGALRGRNIVEGKRKDYLGAPTEQRLEIRDDEKTNCLTTVSKDNLICVGMADIKAHDQRRRVYSTDGKAPTLMTPSGGYSETKIASGELTYRNLTPVECERLQTLPDNYTASVSKTQRYRALGNGWTVDVIAHIFRSMPKCN